MDRLDAASAVVVILVSANKSAMNVMWVCLPFYGLFREFSKLPSSDHQLPATHDDYYHKLWSLPVYVSRRPVTYSGDENPREVPGLPTISERRLRCRSSILSTCVSSPADQRTMGKVLPQSGC
jgi:hypothetical protein